MQDVGVLDAKGVFGVGCSSRERWWDLSSAECCRGQQPCGVHRVGSTLQSCCMPLYTCADPSSVCVSTAQDGAPAWLWRDESQWRPGHALQRQGGCQAGRL